MASDKSCLIIRDLRHTRLLHTRGLAETPDGRPGTAGLSVKHTSKH